MGIRLCPTPPDAGNTPPDSDVIGPYIASNGYTLKMALAAHTTGSTDVIVPHRHHQLAR